MESDNTRDVKSYLATLGEFPRVKDRIEQLWGSDRGRKYLYGLIVDERDRHNSKVNGFPRSAIEAITALLDLHDEFYPNHKPSTDVWDL